VRGFAELLKRNLFGIVALCRVVPGAVFIAFVACGWTRVPLGRFTLATLLVSALYLPLMLCIVVLGTRSMIASDCGPGRSCFACWWRSGFSAGRSSAFSSHPRPPPMGSGPCRPRAPPAS
jgi:uncharacterized membrane protein YdjX (TVP38/TMEM64 family)